MIASTERDDVTPRQRSRPGDAAAVEERTVRRVDVGDGPPVARGLEGGVPTRHRGVIDHDRRSGRVTADRERGGDLERTDARGRHDGQVRLERVVARTDLQDAEHGRADLDGPARRHDQRSVDGSRADGGAGSGPQVTNNDAAGGGRHLGMATRHTRIAERERAVAVRWTSVGRPPPRRRRRFRGPRG